MRRVLASLLLATATLAACRSRPRAPAASDFDVALDSRDDCLHHAAAIAPLGERALLVFGACGHTGEGDEPAGEEIMAVRLDPRGRHGEPQPVEILEAGWATNLVAAAIPGGGAIVGWTAALERKATAFASPVDEQGRPTGEPSALGAGRAAALAPGPQGAALALVTDADSLSDQDPRAGVELSLLVLDADARVVGRASVSRRVEAARAQVALAGDATSYVLVWSEAGMLTATRTDAAGAIGARGAIVPDPTSLGLPQGARFAWPAVTLGAGGIARVASLVELPDGVSAEIWLGEGRVGGPERDWTWRRLQPAGSGRRARLSMARAADGSEFLAWSEALAGEDFPALRTLRLDAKAQPQGAPETATSGVVVFDGAIASARLGSAGVIASAQPPAGSGGGALRVVQRVAAHAAPR